MLLFPGEKRTEGFERCKPLLLRYMQVAFSDWMKKLRTDESPVDYHLFLKLRCRFLVIIALDKEDTSYMANKLPKECPRSGVSSELI